METNIYAATPGEYILRTGDCEAPINKRDYKHTGALGCLLELSKSKDFMSGINPKCAIISYNMASEEAYIKLVSDVYNAQGITILAMARKTHFEEVFKINTDAKFTSKSLAKIIRVNRHRFPDIQIYNDLMDNLNKFQAKVTGEIQNINTNKGYKRELAESNIQTSLPGSFKMLVQIGGKVKTIEIEIDIQFDGVEAVINLYSNDYINEKLNYNSNIVRETINVYELLGIACVEEV